MTCVIALSACMPDFLCEAAEPDRDVEVLKRLGVTTDGMGFTRSVFLDELTLSEEQFAEVMDAIVRIKTIRHIYFCKTPLAADLVRVLPKLKQVNSLSFRNVDLDAGIVHAASRLKDLESVAVFNCQITGDLVSALGKCKNLRTIMIVGSDAIEGDVFSPFVPLKNLTYLILDGCPKVTGEGLAALRHYETLSVLELDKTSVTDEVFIFADNIPTLRKLSVAQTKVTRTALEIFRANHPDIELMPERE
jgi:hypothetical protein